jgi:hypothetical protein
MSAPCTASEFGSGSIGKALFRAFDLQNFGDEIASYYYWLYSDYYLIRQSEPSSLPGQFCEQTVPMASMESLEMLEYCIQHTQRAGFEFTLEPSNLALKSWWPGEEENVWRVWAQPVRGPRMGWNAGKKTRKRKLDLVARWNEKYHS